MKRISSGSTTFFKKLMPLLMVGFLVLFVVSALTRGEVAAQEKWAFVVVPCFITLIVFLIMRKALWVLMDEVQDGGDFLLVRKGSEEERIPLSNVMNVSTSANNPPRITLRLVKPGRFGSEIAFIAPSRRSLDPFVKNPVAEDLIVRAYEARTRSISR
jgi:hypothetical protein